jgi:hypothetical protein
MNLESLNDLPAIWDKLSASEQREILAELDAIEEELSEWRAMAGAQAMAFDSDADIILYGGAAGGGKLLSLDTPIPTINGWTTMGDIKPYDVIFDENGNPCNVIVVEPITTDITYRLKFSDGSEIIAGASHKWVTETLADRSAAYKRTDDYRAARRENRKKKGSGKRHDLALRNSQKEQQYLSIPVPTIKTTQEIVETLYVRGRINHSIPTCNPLNLPAKNLLIDPYVLGAWLGDGTSKSGTITGIDKEIFDEIKKAGFIVTDRADIKDKGILGLQPKLKALEVFGNKHIPADYLRASIEQRLALLQGLMDTDGHCDKRGQCEFTNTNKTLIEQTHELISSLGIKVVICEGIAKLNGKDCGTKYRLKFITALPAFRLPRKLKRQKLNGFRGTHKRRYIVEGQKIESIPMRCIAVDSSSRLYLAGKSFIPTHNTDLALGKGLKQHKRVLILRREFPQLAGIIERSRVLYTPYGKYTASPHPTWRLNYKGVNKIIEMGACQYDDDKLKYQGRPHDLRVLDEAANFLESQVVFLAGWVRSEDPTQKCQLLLVSNPPTNANGQWLFNWFAPWLDPKHHNPAKPGELRWFARINDVDTEVIDSRPFILDGANLIYDFDSSIYAEDDIITPKSRTFIPARVVDNPYYVKSGYIATLQALPEPLRSQMLKGDFAAGRADDAWQTIPTEWVLLAQERWKKTPKPSIPMTALGVDVARGGADKTVITPRFNNWFGKQIVYPGKSTPDGPAVAKLALKERNDNCFIIVDVIGVGASVYDYLRTTTTDPHDKLKMIGFHACEGSEATDKSKKLKFINQRAEWYWKFREALDPANGMNLALPDDSELLADLCAPRWDITPRGIKIESKEEIIERIGRSPDKGDSAIYAFVMNVKRPPHGANVNVFGR